MAVTVTDSNSNATSESFDTSWIQGRSVTYIESRQQQRLRGIPLGKTQHDQDIELKSIALKAFKSVTACTIMDLHGPMIGGPAHMHDLDPTTTTTTMQLRHGRLTM
jgi:hypothetical protein